MGERLGNQIEPFYKLERRKNPDGGVIAERCHYAMKGVLSAIGREGDDAIVIFGEAEARSVQDRVHNMTDINTREILIRSQS